MPSMSARARELRALESLSMGRSAIHRLHPLAKVLQSSVYIAVVASFGRYDFLRLAPYLFYPCVIMAIAGLPYRPMLSRMLVALPLCLFAGISNIIFDRAAAFTIWGVAVSFGVLSMATIILKMYLCVMAALLLVATTQFTELTAQLRRLRVPMVFVMVFETTYRYIGILLAQAHSMATAYRLRSGMKNAIEMRHMGSFAGQLILLGFDRAERVHAAMRCRGYSLRHLPPARRKFRRDDALAAAVVCVPAVVLRLMG